MCDERIRDFWWQKNRIIDENHIKILKPAAWAVYCVYIRRAGAKTVAFPSIGDVMDRTGLSNKGVILALRRLVGLGYLRLQKRGGPNIGSSVYVILEPPIGELGSRPDSGQPLLFGGELSSQGLVKSVHDVGELSSPVVVNSVQQDSELSSQDLVNSVHTKKTHKKKTHRRKGLAASEAGGPGDEAATAETSFYDEAKAYWQQRWLAVELPGGSLNEVIMDRTVCSAVAMSMNQLGARNSKVGPAYALFRFRHIVDEYLAISESENKYYRGHPITRLRQDIGYLASRVAKRLKSPVSSTPNGAFHAGRPEPDHRAAKRAREYEQTVERDIPDLLASA